MSDIKSSVQIISIKYFEQSIQLPRLLNIRSPFYITTTFLKILYLKLSILGVWMQIVKSNSVQRERRTDFFDV